jgi:hypothetical protein
MTKLQYVQEIVSYLVSMVPKASSSKANSYSLTLHLSFFVDYLPQLRADV